MFLHKADTSTAIRLESLDDLFRLNGPWQLSGIYLDIVLFYLYLRLILL